MVAMFLTLKSVPLTFVLVDIPLAISLTFVHVDIHLVIPLTFVRGDIPLAVGCSVWFLVYSRTSSRAAGTIPLLASTPSLSLQV